MFLHLSSISTTTIEYDDNGPVTPKAPRGKRSDITEKDLEEFKFSFYTEEGIDTIRRDFE
jgi:hypothetical protein